MALVLPISAPTRDGLRRLASDYAAQIRMRKSNATGFRDLLYTASRRESALRHRCVIVADGAAAVEEAAAAYAAGQPTKSVLESDANAGDGRAGVALVLSGQAARWQEIAEVSFTCPEPLRELFLDWMGSFAGRADELGWSSPSLKAALAWIRGGPAPRGGESSADDMLTATLLHAGFQGAGIDYLQSCGVPIAAVLGHSAGEPLALYAAGVLTKADSIDVAVRRGYALGRASADGHGRMASIRASAESVAAVAEEAGIRITLAAENSPKMTVVSADGSEIERLVDECDRRGLTVKLLRIRVRAHHDALHQCGAESFGGAGRYALREARCPVFSGVDGGELVSDVGDRAFWIGQLTRPVRFRAALEACLQRGIKQFLEVAPRRSLRSAVAETAQTLHVRARVGSFDRPHGSLGAGLLLSLAEIFCGGTAVRWSRAVDPGTVVDAPCLEMEEQPYWIPEGDWSEASASPSAREERAEPVVRREVVSEIPGSQLCEGHAIRGREILPAAAHVVLAAEVAWRTRDWDGVIIEDLEIHRPLLREEIEEKGIRVSTQQSAQGAIHVRVLSGDAVAAEAKVEEHPASPAQAHPPLEFPAPNGAIPPNTLYRQFASCGVEYSGGFRCVARLQVNGGAAARAEIRVPLETASASSEEDARRAAVSLVDGCLQALAGCAWGDLATGQEPRMAAPKRIGRLQWIGFPRGTAWVEVALDLQGEQAIGRLEARSPDGSWWMAAEGIQLVPLGGRPQNGLEASRRRTLYAPRWWPIEKAMGVGSPPPKHGAPEHPSPAELFVARRVGDGVPERERLKVAMDDARSLVQRAYRLRSNTRGPTRPQLAIVTRGAFAVEAGEDGDPWQAMLWGLTRSLRLEWWEIDFRLVDLDPRTGEAEVEAEWNSDWIAPDGPLGQAIRRGGRRYVQVMERHAEIPHASPSLPGDSARPPGLAGAAAGRRAVRRDANGDAAREANGSGGGADAARAVPLASAWQRAEGIRSAVAAVPAREEQ